uniref:DNA helicase n=1 Tax=Syphacia muris TaxID=451379 RepID=A0A158R4F8_9BILA
MKRSSHLSTINDVEALNNECAKPDSNNEVKVIANKPATVDSPVKKRPKLLIAEETGEVSISTDLLTTANVFNVVVEEIQHMENELRLLSREIRTGKQFEVVLQGIWFTMEVETNDYLRVIAPIKCSDKELIVNDEKGVIILSSNELVSCTTISQAVYCRRKAILNQRFRKNCQNNESMMLGSIVHSLFQAAVRRKPRFLTKSWLLGVWRRELLQSYLSQIVALKISSNILEEKLAPYIDSILKWVKTHMPPPIGNSSPLPDGTVIADVVDIEESLWDPIIGIKGKVDVSIQVKKSGHKEVFKEPLELKTGKSQVNIEHCGQVMLYCYSFAAKEVDLADVGGGTLLYLLDGKTSRVQPKPHDLRGLLHLRNELAAALSNISEHCFPAPLTYSVSCKRCDQAVACSIMQKLEDKHNVKNTNSSGDLAAVLLAHLSDNDFLYFKQWIRWIFLEWNVGRSLKCDVKDIWELPVKRREEEGNCIGNLRAVNIETNFQKSTVKFTSKDAARLPVFFNKRDMVVLSSNNCVAFALGIIVATNDEFIEVAVEVDKRHFDLSSTFVLDRYEVNSVYPINLGNLTLLMQNNNRAEKLRKIIIGGHEPKFGKFKKEDLLRVKPIIRQLNAEQARFVIKSLLAEDYVVAEGFPGSGKTCTIVVLIECLLILGRSVLLTSFTHSAVDNLLFKILERVHPDKLLRLGNNYNEKLKRLTLDGKLEALDFAVDKFTHAKEILEKTPIVACTCLEASSNVLFTFRHFSITIIDEASQSLETALFPPIFSADAFVLVGDSNQLTPLVKSTQARSEGMAVSLLERLRTMTQSTVTLRQQYRMNQTILNISSKLFYDNQMICANDSVAKATMDVSLENFSTTKRFLEMCVSGSLDDAVVFVDTQSVLHPEYQFHCNSLSGVFYNPGEIEVVKEICDALTLVGVLNIDIGVISMYRYHTERLRELLPQSIEVSTVDQFQGRDKSVIILTFAWTVVSDGHDSGLLMDFRRINVALTRAKHKLILVGCRNSLMKVGCNEVMEHVSRISIFSFADGEEQVIKVVRKHEIVVT